MTKPDSVKAGLPTQAELQARVRLRAYVSHFIDHALDHVAEIDALKAEIAGDARLQELVQFALRDVHLARRSLGAVLDGLSSGPALGSRHPHSHPHPHVHHAHDGVHGESNVD